MNEDDSKNQDKQEESSGAMIWMNLSPTAQQVYQEQQQRDSQASSTHALQLPTTPEEDLYGASNYSTSNFFEEQSFGGPIMQPERDEPLINLSHVQQPDQLSLSQTSHQTSDTPTSESNETLRLEGHVQQPNLQQHQPNDNHSLHQSNTVGGTTHSTNHHIHQPLSENVASLNHTYPSLLIPAVSSSLYPTPQQPPTPGFIAPTPNSQAILSFPCKARGIDSKHNQTNAYIQVPQRSSHGALLVCSHLLCASSGRRFRWCSVCKVPAAKRNFMKRHSHGIITSHRFTINDYLENEMKKDEAALIKPQRRRSSSFSDSDETKTRPEKRKRASDR